MKQTTVKSFFEANTNDGDDVTVVRSQAGEVYLWISRCDSGFRLEDTGCDGGELSGDEELAGMVNDWIESVGPLKDSDLVLVEHA